jgi:hypothetical protein
MWRSGRWGQNLQLWQYNLVIASSDVGNVCFVIFSGFEKLWSSMWICVLASWGRAEGKDMWYGGWKLEL